MVIGQVSRLLIRFPVSLQLVVVRLAIRIWKPVGSVTCVQVYCFTVLPFYAFLLLSYLHMHLSAACSLALLHMERLKPLPPQSRYDFSTVECVSVRDAWIHHPPTTSTKQPFGS